MSKHLVSLIPGDGIGPEISEAVQYVFKHANIPIEFEIMPAGESALKDHGDLLPKKTIDSLKKTKLGLKGPTTTPVGGGHRSINVAMRQLFDLYANVRPVLSLPGLETKYDSIDMIIVRENTEDLYKGVEYMIGDHTAHGIKIITAEGSRRIAQYAFDLAKNLNRKKVSAVHKANIMKLTDGLFLEACRKVSKNYPSIQYDEIIVDNCCMQMVTKPKQFDVIVTENLYGDIVSDLASGLIGGLGVAAGSNIGKDMAIFEAVHGSAPDIAGKGIANPTALLCSGIMMLEHCGLQKEAANLKSALQKVMSHPDKRTKDLGGKATTMEFAKHLADCLKG